MSRNSCEVGTGAMSFHVVFIVAVVGGTVGGCVGVVRCGKALRWTKRERDKKSSFIDCVLARGRKGRPSHQGLLPGSRDPLLLHAILRYTIPTASSPF